VAILEVWEQEKCLGKRSCKGRSLQVRTELFGNSVSTSFLVERREDSVRPIMIILAAPDFANACAIRGPMPDPPPVMKTTFPAVESSGRDGSMAGYEKLWKILVYCGNAIVSPSWRMDVLQKRDTRTIKLVK
jgi:hypothetical protein